MEQIFLISTVVQCGGQLMWERPATKEQFIGTMKPLSIIEYSLTGKPLRFRIEFDELLQNVGYPQDEFWLHSSRRIPYHIKIPYLHIENIMVLEGGSMIVHLPDGEIAMFYPKAAGKRLVPVSRTKYLVTNVLI